MVIREAAIRRKVGLQQECWITHRVSMQSCRSQQYFEFIIRPMPTFWRSLTPPATAFCDTASTPLLGGRRAPLAKLCLLAPAFVTLLSVVSSILPRSEDDERGDYEDGTLVDSDISVTKTLVHSIMRFLTSTRTVIHCTVWFNRTWLLCCRVLVALPLALFLSKSEWYLCGHTLSLCWMCARFSAYFIIPLP